MKWGLKAIVVALVLHATCCTIDKGLPFKAVDRNSAGNYYVYWDSWENWSAFNQAVRKHGLHGHMYSYWREGDYYYYHIITDKGLTKDTKLFKVRKNGDN